MRTSDIAAMDFKRDNGRWLVRQGCKWTCYGRVLEFCRFMTRFMSWGDWSVRETCASSACRGTVYATLNGPRGKVEATNGLDVCFTPKGVKPSREPNWREVDAANGIVWWDEPPWHRGKSRQEHWDDFGENIAEACRMAGIKH